MKNINPDSKSGQNNITEMRRLMGNMTLKENDSKRPSSVEKTKLGSDNKVYGIVKEDHKYYIKTTDKINDPIVENFDYIGGIQNKETHAYPSYSKAIKTLNGKMMSLREETDEKDTSIDLFKDDGLLYKGEDINEAEYSDFVEEDLNEGELKVGNLYNDGPKELDGNTVGDFEDVTDGPDKSPNDKSTGTVKNTKKKASPKKTIKEAVEANKKAILETLSKYDSLINESLAKKKS